MPVTPFHFGPGLLFKATGPGVVSWTMFALSNVMIDLEPILWYLTTGDPVHGVLHTVIGATVLGIGVALVGRRPCEALLRGWNTRLSTEQARWLAVDPQISQTSALVSALLGTGSHILLDSQMHADMNLWWPLVSGNSWRGVVEVDALHWACVASGLIGALWLSARRLGARSRD